jgi:serine protease AprX
MIKNRWRVIHVLFAFFLTFSLLLTSTGSALAKKDKPPRMDPDFLKMVQSYPDATFRVIVQKVDKNQDLRNRKRNSDPDTELEDNVHSNGGRVERRFGLIVSFSAEMTGREIEKLARNPKVNWISPDAPVISADAQSVSTVLDTFNGMIYDGNDGIENWAGSWIEGDQSGDAAVSTADVGIFRVDESYACADNSGYCLLVVPGIAAGYLYREVNLKDATNVTLSLYRYNPLNRVRRIAGAVNLEISKDGGATWVTLRTYSGNNYTGSDTDTFDITDFASTNTRIRFYIADIQSDPRGIYFDNIQIEYTVSNASEAVDGIETTVNSPYREVVGAEALESQTGLDGQGVTVAVVDSGISDHADLHQNSNNLSQALKSESRVIDNVVFGGYASPTDQYAHGTHVAGIIAGDGVASGGEYTGIAPGVNLLNVRVSNDQGMTYTSDLVDGLQWVYDNKDVYNIRVVNLSVTSTAPESYDTSPLDAAVEILWLNGITVVVSAGNNGTVDGPVTLYPPANDPFVITVGAMEDQGTPVLDDDFVAAFSAYGTTEAGFTKPELVAPGRNLISLLAGIDATAYKDHPKHRVNDFYFRMSGTSMAAPVVSGAIALLLQNEPSLTPDQIKFRLMATASQNWPGYDKAKAGAGTVDAYAAVFTPTSESANQGIVPSHLLATGEDAIAFDSVGWNSVGWNSVGWNTVGWNTVGWNTVGWNSVGWNTVGWNTSLWDD